jgi:hypothetical protein
VERGGVCLLTESHLVRVALGSILEAAIPRDIVPCKDCTALEVGVALWHGGLPVDVLPAQGTLPVALGAEAFAWSLQKREEGGSGT